MKKNAFTLAEVLITLVIIGVIAAMTIPTLMGSTNNQEIKSAAKKASSAIQQAAKLDYALYGTKSGCENISQNGLAQILKNHMSVISEDVDNNNWIVLTTADGMIYYVTGCDSIDVDLNGRKGSGIPGEDYMQIFLESNGTVTNRSTQPGMEFLNYSDKWLYD